jgi:membrane protease YdiL (CAAX protease family)
MPQGTPPDNPPQEARSTAETSPQIASLSPSPAEAWTLRDLLFFAAFTSVWLLLSPLLTYTGYVALQPLVGWRIPLPELRNNAFFAVASQTLFYLPVLGYIYLLVVVHYRQPFWRGLAWRKLRPDQALRYLLGGILLSMAVLLVPPLLPEAKTFPLQRLFTSAPAAYAVGAFAILIAPFMEEVIFRGVLFAIFERRVGLGFAVVATAMLFAGLHVPEYWRAWNHALLILVVGVVFSLARGVTGSLTPSVILHIGYNASMMAGLFLQTQHFRTLQGVLAP